MELQKIEVPKHKALKAFQEYREEYRKTRKAEDAILMRGYKAIVKGQGVIQIADVIKRGGLDEKGRPKLAIVRADAKTVWLRRRLYSGAEISFSLDSWPERGRVLIFHNLFDVPEKEISAKVIVPSIPPPYRPKGSLARYYLLWEADWEAVPRDPVLLKPLGKGLYVVLATWELTELERAVLAG